MLGRRRLCSNDNLACCLRLQKNTAVGDTANILTVKLQLAEKL